MLRFPEETPIYLKTGITDMRKSINGLSALVQNEMKKNPFESGYFLFCGKTKRILKLLYWDKTGFALWYKRLEQARFPWPEKEEEARRITAEQVTWLLAGIDFFKAHKKLSYSRV
jgi:transposase